MCTIIVKAAPLFATILCRWFGRFAIPIGLSLSAVAEDIVKVREGLQAGEEVRRCAMLWELVVWARERARCDVTR